MQGTCSILIIRNPRKINPVTLKELAEGLALRPLPKA